MMKNFKTIIMGYFLALLLMTAFAWADSIEIEPVNSECVVGENLYFKINITLDEEKEIDVSDVTYNGKALKYDASQSSNSSFSFSINGRTIKQSSGIEKSFVFELPTDKEGEIVLPSYNIKIGGKDNKVRSLRFQVLKKPTSADFQFRTRIVNFQKQYYPTQIIEFDHKLYYREFPGSPSDLEFVIPVLDENRFSFLPDPGNPDGYVIVNNQRFGIHYSEGKEILDGKEYQVFSFRLKFRLMKPGDFRFTNSAKAQVETGRTYRRRGFFGTELVKEKKPVYADSPAVMIKVLDLPSENVPPSFNGAIGNFKIKVIPSSDTDLKVGDPITLSIEITGRGTWEFVKCPPVHKIPAITDYFIVSSDPVIGDVSEDGTTKTFLLRMRVKSKTVKEIPPIPFTFFNLISQKYVTVTSEKIPISVFESSRKIEVVDFAQTQGQEKGTDSNLQTGQDQKPLSPDNRKLLNEPLPELIPILDNVPGTDITEDHATHYHQMLSAIIPLFIVCVVYLFIYIRNLNVGSELISKNKKKMAYQIFKTNISHLEKKDIDGSFFYRDLGRNILKFMENRYQVASDEITADILNRLVSEKELNTRDADALLNLYEEVQVRRYSSEKFNEKDAKTLPKNVKEALKKCR